MKPNDNDQHLLESGLGVYDCTKFKKYFKNQKPADLSKLKKGEKYQDPSFPPNFNSIIGKNTDGNFTDPENGPTRASHFKEEDYEWKSAKELLGCYLIFEENIEFSDIKQGSLGNCYFLSALSALTELPHLIFQIFRNKEINDFGYYEIALFIDGEWQVVIVDDYFPINKKTQEFAFARPNGNELWCVLLEKAWAKVNGGYVNTIAGWPSDPLAAITGFSCELIKHEDDADDLWDYIANCDKANNIMVSSTYNDTKLESLGLVSNHAYTLIGAKEYKKAGKEICLLKLRNPWGFKEWNGDWSDKSSLWTKDLKAFFEVKDVNDGSFYMTLDDFKKYFQITHICHIMFDSHVKSFRIKEKDQLDLPHVYNIYIPETANLSLSLIFRHWRYNRQYINALHPASMVLAKYDPENTSVLKYIGGVYSGNDNLELVKKVEQGFYVVWFYAPTRFSKEPLPDHYIFRIFSGKDYRVAKINNDTKCELIKKIITDAIKDTYADKIKLKQNSFFTQVENSYKKSGLGYRIVINNSQGLYHLWQHSVEKIQNMKAIVPYENKESFEIHVPPNESSIVLGMRTESFGTYWFNLTSGYQTYNVEDQELTLKPNKYKASDFLTKNFAKENIDEGYYNYDSITIEEAMMDLNFSSVNLNDVKMNQLREDHSEQLDKLLKLSLLNKKDESKYSFGKSLYQNGYYIGEYVFKNSEKQREGRGLYYFENDEVSYYGYWKDNVKSKSGSYYHKDFLVYEGEMDAGKKNGEGILYYVNGDKYEGSFENDIRKGHGKFIWKDGSSWEGPFENNKMNGTGMYTGEDSESWEVKYLDGRIAE